MSGLHDAAPQPITEFETAARPPSLQRNGWYAPFSFEIGNWIARYVPRPLSRAFAVSMGQLGYQFCQERREALMSNLAVLTSDRIAQEKLCRTCFVNFLRMLHDFCDSAAGGIPRLEQLLVERRGFQFLENGRKRGKGTLLLTGHLGAWELGGMALAAEGLPVSVVTLEEPTPELDAWRQKYRAKFGIKTITVGSDKFAFLEIMQALRRNELVAMLVDRPYLNSGVEVKFFDRPTLFSAAAARIWQHTDATIIPAFVLQLQPGRYGCYAYPPIEMHPDSGPEENSQRVADVFQAIIREFPDQWFNFVPIWTR
jgi:Kdo2-lipid IVA lauroyltransferase/acyltransferase